MASNPDFDGSKSTDEAPPDDDTLSPSAEDQAQDGPEDQSDQSAQITLSPDQLKDAGLDHLEEGDAFTVTLHGTVTQKGDDNGITADVDELSDGMIEGTLPNATPSMTPAKLGPTIKGPAAAGLLSPGSPMLPDDSQ